MNTPPSGWRSLLRRFLPPAERDVMLSELDDLFELRVQRDGPAAARRWYRGQVWRFPIRLAADASLRVLYALFTPTAWSRWMSADHLLRDVRYAVRRLVRTPGFSAVAVISLALGIGGNTAMFSIVNAVLLADPPFRDAEELVEIYTSDADGFVYGTSSYPDLLDLREQSTGVFDDVVGARTFIAATGPVDQPEMLAGEAVTWNAFVAQGINPILGRGFTLEEDGPVGTDPVVVLNHRTWMGRFGGDPGVLGTTLRLNQTQYTIVGVMPEWFTGSFPAFHSAVWIPSNMTMAVQGSDTDPNERRGSRSLFVRGRLADGVSVDQANAWLEGFAAGLSEEYPQTNEDRRYTALRLDDVLLHPAVDRALVPVAGLLMAMVGVVLLVACANLASFLLARAEQRRREIAVRLSLGASRASLVRQLLVETTLLALLGGVAGVFVAQWAIRALVSFQPPVPVPLNLDFPLDGTVLAFTFGASLVAGTLFGLAPALQATRPDLAQTLRDESGSVTGSSRLRNVLVVAQVSMSLVLLVTSGLFVRSLLNAQSMDPGFYTGPAAVLWPHYRLTGMSDEEARLFHDALQERWLATPGITGAAATDILPLGFGVQTRALEIPGAATTRADGLLDIDFSIISPSYLEVMEIPMLSGRTFQDTDLPEMESVGIVSRAFERAFFPGGAVGRVVRNRDQPVRIVGVAEDAKVRTIGEEPRPRIYFSTTQENVDLVQWVVRGTGTGAEILARARTVALELEPELVLFDQRTMEQQMAVHLFPPRVAAGLLSVFGGLALLLAAIGIFGVVSHAVARRTREVGIRMSLGASARNVVSMLVQGGMRVVVFGLLVGLALAGVVGQAVDRFLYGVGGLDAVAFLGVPLLLFAVALTAAWLPARRAARIDPVRALRAE